MINRDDLYVDVEDLILSGQAKKRMNIFLYI